MNIINKVKTGFQEFMLGSKIILGKPEPGEGNRKLAKISKIVEAQIPLYGKNIVRKQVISSIEKDIKRKLKKGNEAVEQMIQEAIATPEYMTMLKELGIGREHIEVVARGAMIKARWRSK